MIGPVVSVLHVFSHFKPQLLYGAYAIVLIS